MKTRIAYNLVTGEIIECRCSKKSFWRKLYMEEGANRAWGIRKGRWVFRNPWG